MAKASAEICRSAGSAAGADRTIVLDFDGGVQRYRNTALGVEIPADIAPSGIGAARQKHLAAALRREGFDIAPTGGRTIHIGKTSAFDAFGRFAGLAEGIGAGDAFVLLDDSASDAELLNVIRHEAGHILGTLDHGGAGLARYAFTHTLYRWEFQGRGLWGENVYDGRIGAPYLWNTTITSVTYTAKAAPANVDNISLVAEVGYTETVYTYDFECKEWSAELNGYHYTRLKTSRDEILHNYDYYYEASGIKAAGTISIYGGKADNCTAYNMEVRGHLTGYDVRTEGNQDEWYDKTFGFVWAQGTATECKVTNKMTVYGRAVALNCQAYSLVVGDSAEYYGADGPSKRVSGKAVGCTVSYLNVEPGGVVQNIRVDGYANIGLEANTPEDKAKVDAIIAERGNAKVTNFYYNTANKRGGSGSLYAYRGAEVTNVDTEGTIFAREGAILKGSLTCGSVGLQGVTPQSNITIKLDLHDYASANYWEHFSNINGEIVKTVEYFANYTTRTIIYGKDEEGFSTYTYSYGTFDNADGRFDMRDWVYTFSVHIGNVDALALPYITVDFGGTESDFGGGSLSFDYPSSSREIQFVMNSNKEKWHEVWEDSWGNDLGEYQGWLVYDPTLHGEVEDVLWLENGEDEGVEYTVTLPSSVMGGAQRDVEISGAEIGEVKLQGNSLVFKGGADTGNITVKAEDKNNVQHECELDLVVVPEELPLLGKEGARIYSGALSTAQKQKTTKVSVTLPNVHINNMFGAKFDASSLGMNFTVNWTTRTAELKIQGKLEWTPSGAMAGSGKQVKLVIDLSGDNYIGISHNFNTKKFDWNLVGEMKIPDFKIGQLGFSNMVLKANTVQHSFFASANVELPGVKYSFGGSIGIVDGCIDSLSICMDSLNIPFGATGMMLQTITAGFSGVATKMVITLEAGMGLTFGPKKHLSFKFDWLGLDEGDYYIAELKLDTHITTDGEYTGTAEVTSLGGFITGGGKLHIYNGNFTLDGNFKMLGGCISAKGTLNASDGKFTIAASGKMQVPNERVFGPLAGLGLSVNTFTDFNKRYVKAWQETEIFGNKFAIGIKSTFDGDISLLGSTDLLREIEVPKREMRTLKSISVTGSGEGLRGAATPSASEKYIVADYGVSLFQVNLSVSAAEVSTSLVYDGVEYTQADIAAGLYGNMQIVSEFSNDNVITIAVENAGLGEWTINSYGDSDALFNAFTMADAVTRPQLDAVVLGETARSATIRYTLSDYSALENATISVFRTTADDTEHQGLMLAEMAIEDATGIFEYEMREDESHGGAYAFYIMVNSDSHTPVYSVISDAYTFADHDIMAPNQIQSIDAIYLSTGSTLAWEAPYDDFAVVGYKVGYRASEADEWTETDVAEPTFTFNAVPNGIYTYRVAACDAAGNVAAWSVEDSVLVNLGSNATYRNASLTEDTALAEYEGAVSVDASAVKLTAAKNSLVSASTLGAAEIRGIAENTVFSGEAELFEGAQGRDLTVSGHLNVGVNTEEEIEALNPFVDEIPESVINTTNLATAENVNVVSGGTLTVGSFGRANGVTVSSGGALHLSGDAKFSGVAIDYGAVVTISGNGRYDLTDDIAIAGKLNTNRNVYGNGYKIRFEQYKQTAEFQNSLDDVAFVSDMDKLVGDVLEIEIDSEAYGSYKIADEAKYFDSTIKIVSHNDGSAAKVGLGEFTLVDNALCRLVYYNDKYGTYGLYLDVARSQIDAPTLSVENAENDYEDTISVSAAPADGTGEVTQYTFRYSTNADMSDAVIVTPQKNTFTIAKDELTANATYYMQVSVENTNGVQSLWSEARSFTVIPKLNRPDAPLLSIDYADNRYWNYFTVSANYDWYSREKQYSFRYSLNADMSDAVVVTADEWYSYIDLAKDDFTANTAYYIQGRAKNREDIWGDWGTTTSFTVVPVSDVPPAAPTNLTVTETDGGAVGLYRLSVYRDTDNYDIKSYRFRYADNPEMENAVTVSTSSADYNYTTVNRSDLENGKVYYFQSAVKLGTEWSSWSDSVSVRNTLGWNYENITVDVDGPYAKLSLNGKRARNVTVVDGGYFYGGGRVDGLTVEAGGFFRSDSAEVTNAVVNGGNFWLYEGGNVTDLVINSGELRLINGTLNGAFIGAGAVAEITGYNTPTLTGTITIAGGMQIYYYHPGITSDANFVFDLGAHEGDKDKFFIDYAAPLSGSRTFTVKLDDTPETGNYKLTHTPASGEFSVGLVGADGSSQGVLSLSGEAVLYDNLYYSLIQQSGETYLHVSDSDAPVFLGKVKLAKNGAVYDSEDSYRDLEISGSDDCDYALVEAGGRLTDVTIGPGGAVDAYGEVRGATIGNGGRLTMNAGGLFSDSPVTIDKGGEVVINGGSVRQSAKFNIAGTLTVNGALRSYEDNDGSYYPVYHDFNFVLSEFASPNTSVMISDYELLKTCDASFSVSVSANQAEGEYQLMGNAANYAFGITLYIEGGASYGDYIWFGGNGSEINGRDYALSVKDDILTLTVGESAPPTPIIVSDVIARTQWWDQPSDTGSYVVEYSTDDFEHAVRIVVNDTALDSYAAPAGCQWRVRPEGSGEWTEPDTIYGAPTDGEPKFVRSNADGVDDVFFARANGTWDGGYQAKHVGSLDSEWAGTGERVGLAGKNRLGDFFEGSYDANVLLLTDDANGDALFVDDIYTALPGSLEEQQARIAQIYEIRAGAGDDIVDMTSQRFEYVGDGLTIRGGGGDDTIWAVGYGNYLFGDAGNDRIVGASGFDFIAGGAGDDSMHGGGGMDVFTFGGNWGKDIVEQLGDEESRVMLWFAEGDHAHWDASTLTYTDGSNSVTVMGVTADQVEIYIGDEFPWDFEMMSELGIFADATSENVFEGKNKGLLATL
ncbi:MAG: hypothetical protein MR051_04615 [Lentisphaeria bacterium]|nr:hypothetical protein [Lentisphaeria bacterium]